MVGDVLLSFGQAAIAVTLGWLGMLLTVHPISIEEVNRRRRYKIFFLALSISGLVLVVWQGIRNSASQQDAAEQRLKDTLQITEQSSKIDDLNMKVDSLINQVSLRDSELVRQGKTQTQIAELEFALKYEPILTLSYVNKQLRLFNGGASALTMLGLMLDSTFLSMEIQQLSPGIASLFNMSDREQRISSYMQKNHIPMMDLPIRVYFSDALKKRYTAVYRLRFKNDSAGTIIEMTSFPNSHDPWPKEISSH